MNHISTTRPSPPAARTTSGATGTPGSGSVPTPSRPFALVAPLAGAGVALGGLLLLSAVAVVGWFLADAGAHGDTRDAIRVAADAWLVAHGSHLTLGGVEYGVVPLGLSLLLALGAWRGAGWAARVGEPEDERETACGVGLFVAGYLVVAVGAAVLAGTDAAQVSLVRVVLGAVVLSGIVGGASVLRTTDRWDLLTDRLPVDTEHTLRVLRAAARTVRWVVGASLVTVLVPLGLHAGSVSSMLTAQDLSGGDLLMLALVSVVALPNAALLGVGYLAGPGFAVGTGTTVSTGSVLLGPVPAFPLLGALPSSGATPWWTDLLLVVPPLLAMVAVVRQHRRDEAVDWRHGVLAGLLAGVVLGLLSGLGGGSLGDGRMSQVGTDLLLVTLFMTLSVAAGGLVGGALAPLLSRAMDLIGLRRRAVDDEEETTVVLPSQAAISPALAARLRSARAQGGDAEEAPSRPPFAPGATFATSPQVSDDEETVSVGDGRS